MHSGTRDTGQCCVLKLNLGMPLAYRRLRRGCSVKWLGLADNFIGDAGGAALAAALNEQYTLRLGGNGCIVVS